MVICHPDCCCAVAARCVCVRQGFETTHLNAETGPFAGLTLQLYPMQFRVDVLNALLASKKVSVFTKADGTPVFKQTQASEAK